MGGNQTQAYTKHPIIGEELKLNTTCKRQLISKVKQEVSNND